MISKSRRAFLVSSAHLAAGAAAATSACAEVVPGAKAAPEQLMMSGGLPDVVEGQVNAPVTIIEYASMTCTHCAAFHTNTYDFLREHYIDSGAIKFIIREFPLDQLATAAFMLARVAGDRRDEVIDLMFLKQRAWAFTDKPLMVLSSLLGQAGISAAIFEATLKDRQLYENVKEVRQYAEKVLAVNSTPTFFVNGDRYVGEVGKDDFKEIVEVLLKR